MYSKDPVFEEDKVSAQYHVSGSAPFALGHYPSDPIFPGVMSLQCMEELCNMLFSRLSNVAVRQVEVKRVSYLDIIRPGDILNINCRLKKQNNDETHFQTVIEVDGTVKCKSSFIYRH